MLPKPLLAVVGATPIGAAVTSLAEFLDFEVTTTYEGAAAVVVAGLGRNEEQAVRAALDAGVPYIALVAGRRRGAALLDEMALTPAERSRVRPHPGLDIGARTPKEIALSILAELIQESHRGVLTSPPTTPPPTSHSEPTSLPSASTSPRPADPAPPSSAPAASASAASASPTPDPAGTAFSAPAPATPVSPAVGASPSAPAASALTSAPRQPAFSLPTPAPFLPSPSPRAPRQTVDPVCGMTVFVDDDTPHAVVDGQEHWFCCVRCRDKFVAA
ncbi:XdhC family protein [Actinoplanes sp. URMC 104]|uniref:XdhC family protein n=1 Tax=Actinoplanes sp. URMC 104 TaxID=3423409 RepID=UPI003F1DBAD2